MSHLTLAQDIYASRTTRVIKPFEQKFFTFIPANQRFHCNTLQSRNIENIQAEIHLAETYFAEGSYSQSMDCFVDIHTSSKARVDQSWYALKRIGEICLKTGHYDMAESAFGLFLNDVCDDPVPLRGEITYKLGQCQVGMGELEKAVIDFQESEAIFRHTSLGSWEHFDALYSLGRCYSELNMMNELLELCVLTNNIRALNNLSEDLVIQWAVLANALLGYSCIFNENYDVGYAAFQDCYTRDGSCATADDPYHAWIRAGAQFFERAIN